MPPCPVCQQPATKRNGRDRRGRRKDACRACRRSVTDDSVSACSGYRRPADVSPTAVRWYLAYPLSSRQALELLAERSIDVSHRTVLDWVQAFGPQQGTAVHRREALQEQPPQRTRVQRAIRQRVAGTRPASAEDRVQAQTHERAPIGTAEG